MSGSIDSLSLASPETAVALVESIDLGTSPAFSASGGFGQAEPRSLRAPLRSLFQEDTGRGPGDVPAAPTASMAEPASGSDIAGLRVKAGFNQVFMVGNQLLSFNKEVTEERRAAAINSSLLAQLRASQLHPDPGTPAAARAWHATYINTLTNIGWSLKSGVTARHGTAGEGASVGKALLDIVGVLLGGGTAAALVAKAIEEIATAGSDDPFVALYASRVVEQNVVEFAAGLASGAASDFLLSVVECAVQVRSAQRQILFFKWSADSAEVDGRRFDLSVSDAVYAAARPIIEQKLAAHAQAFVASLDVS